MRFGNTFAVGATRTRPLREAAHEARRGAQVAGLVGLAARGVLYLVLSVLALNLVFGKRRGNDVDARGAMEELARHDLGSVLLVILAIGFAGFALWYAYEALTGHNTSHEGPDRIADGARGVAYGLLCVLAIVGGARRSLADERTASAISRSQTERVLAVRGAARPAPPPRDPERDETAR